MDNVRIAQYAYNDGDLQGLVPEIIWNDEIINIGIGIGLNKLFFHRNSLARVRSQILLVSMQNF